MNEMLSAVLVLLLGIVVILAIIAANGYFVAQEFAYMSVDRSRLAAQADAGDEAAEKALSITRRTSFMLSGAQLGITVTGLLTGYVAEPLIGESLGTLLGGVGVPPAVSITVGTVGALVLATVVQMIFGELYPKNLAIAAPEPLAKALAGSTRIYLAATGWLITFFDRASNALLRLFGITPVEDVDSTATSKDLERIVEDSKSTGDLPEELSDVLDRTLEFPEEDAKHAMIPRTRVGVVRPEITIGELRAMMAGGHSRYPVVTPEEEPIGVVQLIDLLATDLPDDAPVEKLMRPALVIPELMKLPDALEELTKSHNQLACVIDEYGGLEGVLTVEDIAEEFVGDLTDEHDLEPAGVIDEHPHHEDTWTMDGDAHLDEVERAVGHDIPVGDYETIAGLAIAYAGELPGVGETIVVPLDDDPRELVEDEVTHRVLDITVTEIERHVPTEVRVRMRDLTTEEWEAMQDPEDEPATGADAAPAEGGSRAVRADDVEGTRTEAEEDAR